MRLLALLFLLVAVPALAKSEVTLPTIITKANGKQILLSLEIAADAKTRTYGLMHRTQLAPSDGMVFLLPRQEALKFWMKNTQIPLDLLFVDADGRIVAIMTGKPLDLTPIGPDIPILSVIEIDGGRATRDGISIGNKVRYDTQIYRQQTIR